MPIALRQDFDAITTRAAAKLSKDSGQTRRLLALAAIYEGASRTQAARIGGVTLQIIRDWVVKFNAGGPSGLIDRKPPGQPARLVDIHHTALIKMIEQGPDPQVHGVVRWRLIDLARRLEEDFQLEVSIRTLRPGAASAGLSEAVGKAPPSGSEPGRAGGVPKGGFAAELLKVKASIKPSRLYVQA